MKPDCAHASALLSAYIDGMLDEAQTQAVRLHLETCAACGTEYAQLVRIREALLRVPEVPLPAEFDARLKRALASAAEDAPADPALRAKEGRARPRRNLRLWSSAAAVFAIGLLSFFVYNNFPEVHIDLTSSSADSVGGAASAVAEDTAVAELVDGGFSASDAERENAVAPKTDAIEPAADEGADAGSGADALTDATAETVLPARIYTDDAERPVSYERYEMPGYPARGTTTGAHRLNEKALYDEMLKERLNAWNYEILEEEKRDGVYVYRVNMISNESGTEFNQEIEVVAFGNALHIYYASEFMGF